MAPTEYELASIQRSDALIARIAEQNAILGDIRGHTRGMTAVIVVLLGLVILASFISIVR